MQAGPGFCVDLGLEGGFQGFVGIVGAEEVGVAHEEALFVVVRVDKPAGDALGAVGAHLAGLRMEHVHAPDLDPKLPGADLLNVDIGLAEDHKQIALAGVLEIIRHMQIGVDARFKHRDAPQLVDL